MKKITCEIIKDILPLYVDDVVSADTRTMVEAHLAECESCKKEAEVMSKSIKIPLHKTVEKEQAEVLNNLKKTFKNKKIRISIISVLATAGVLAGAYSALVLPKIYIPYEEKDFSVEVVDGNVYASYKGAIEYGGSAAFTSTEDKKTVFYLYTNPWKTYIEPLFNKKREESLIYIGKADAMQKIYYGKFDLPQENYETTWENAEKVWVK